MLERCLNTYCNLWILNMPKNWKKKSTPILTARKVNKNRKFFSGPVKPYFTNFRKLLGFSVIMLSF